MGSVRQGSARPLTGCKLRFQASGSLHLLYTVYSIRVAPEARQVPVSGLSLEVPSWQFFYKRVGQKQLLRSSSAARGVCGCTYTHI